MKYTNVIKKETKVMMVIVSLLLVLVIGSSYALFLRVSSSRNNQVVTTGTLQITYDSSNGYINNSTYPDLTPMTDEDGLNLTGYNFSVKNTGNLKTEYKVYIYVDEASFNADHPGESLFTDLNSIKYNLKTNSVEDNTVNVIGTQQKISDNNVDKYELYSGVVENTNNQNNHSLKVWLDPSLDTSNIGKYIYLKLEVQSNVKE